MGPQAAARAVVLTALAALIFAGVGFAGYAVYLTFAPLAGLRGAAAITAVILLAVPVLWIVILALRANTTHAPSHVDDNMLAALAAVAKDKPLLAVLLAGVVGVASAVNPDKK